MTEIDWIGPAAITDGRVAPPTREFVHRRPTWRAGTSVPLANGTWWWLPPLDMALTITCARFRREANTALRLAQQIDDPVAPGQNPLVRTAVYHAQMVQMGVTLLQQNYDLDDDTWLALVTFAEVNGTLQFSRVVSEVFAAAVPCWAPLLVRDRLVV